MDIDGYLDKVRHLIDEYGWAVQYVAGAPDAAPFAYTVGLTAIGRPELVIFGLLPEVATPVLNDVAGRVRDGGALTHGQELDDVLAGGHVLLAVDVDDPSEHLTVAQTIAGPDRAVSAVQLVYADPQGRWPWQEGSTVAPEPVLGSVPPGYEGE